MSVVFIIAPVVVGAWPAVSALATAAAGVLGYAALSQQVHATVTAKGTTSVDVSLDETTTEELARVGEQVAVFERSGVQITFYQDQAGRAAVQVQGRGKTDATLKRVGTRFLQEVRKQYAYRKVVTDLRERGFELVREEASSSGEIHLRVRRMG